MLQSLPPVSRFLLIGYVVGFIAAFLPQHVGFMLLPLSGHLVYPGLQVWRLVTYPFMVLSFYGLIGAGIVVYFFCSELETIVHTDRLWKVLLGLVISGGLIFTFLAPDGALGGPEIITIFLLTGFTYLWPKRQISVFGMFFIPAWVITLAFFVIMILPSNGTHLDMSASKVFAPIFAAVAALLYFHLIYQQYAFGREIFQKLRRTGSVTAGTGGSGWNDTLTTQARIDKILDKIARTGMASLTREEKEFLLENSKN